MCSDNDCGSNDSAAAEPSTSIVDEVRRFTVQRLNDGASPCELSFALAFVATEMGLCVRRGQSPLPVFQTVLQALATATTNESQGAVSSQDDEADAVPAGATVH